MVEAHPRAADTTAIVGRRERAVRRARVSGPRLRLRMPRKRKRAATNCNPYMLVRCVGKLRSAEFIELHLWRAKVIEDDGVCLFHNDKGRVLAAQAPEYHCAAPEGAAVGDFGLEAVLVGTELLKARREQEDPRPPLQGQNSAHVHASMQPAVLARPIVHGEDSPAGGH